MSLLFIVMSLISVIPGGSGGRRCCFSSLRRCISTSSYAMPIACRDFRRCGVFCAAWLRQDCAGPVSAGAGRARRVLKVNPQASRAIRNRASACHRLSQCSPEFAGLEPAADRLPRADNPRKRAPELFLAPFVVIACRGVRRLAEPRRRRFPWTRRTACRPWGWPNRAPAPERSAHAGRRDGRSCQFRAVP